MVEGKLYQVDRFDFDGRKAFVREVDCDYYTDAITYTRVTSLDTFEQDPSIRRRRTAKSHVVSRVVGFKKIKFYTNENVGSGELDLPEQQMHTTSYLLTIPESVMGALPYAADDRRDGIVGLSFAMRQVAQLLLMCDRHDIGISIDSEGESENPAEPAVTRARIFVYDNYPGGIGFSAPLYRMHRELLDDHTSSDRRVRMRERLSGLCRAGRQHRTAGQGRRAQDSHLLLRARARGSGGHGDQVRVSSLTIACARSSSRPRRMCRSGVWTRMLAAGASGRLSNASSTAWLAMARAASSSNGTCRHLRGAAGRRLASWPPGSRRLPTKRRSSAAACPHARHSSSSISKPRA